MHLSELIEKIAGLTEADRLIDASIAQVAGYRKEVVLNDESAAERRRQVLWFAPGSDEPGRVPFFTSSLDAAFQLSQSVFPGHVAAFSREANLSSAAINDRPPVYAASPAIAICVATLTLKLEKDGDLSLSQM